MKINHRIINFAALYLLTVLGGDAFVVWDLIEGFGIGVHRFTMEDGTTIEMHYHDESGADKEQHAEGRDSCLLCPCCVSNVHMVLSGFGFAMITSINGTVEQVALRLISYIPSPVHRPPINLLS